MPYAVVDSEAGASLASLKWAPMPTMATTSPTRAMTHRLRTVRFRREHHSAKFFTGGPFDRIGQGVGSIVVKGPSAVVSPARSTSYRRCSRRVAARCACVVPSTAARYALVAATPDLSRSTPPPPVVRWTILSGYGWRVPDQLSPTAADIGEPSIYLRWPDKTSLLTDALRQVQLGVTVEAAGGAADGDIGEPPAEPSLRDYLIVHATRRANLYLSDAGIAMLRLYVEARAHPDVFADIRRRAITDFVLDERRRVEAAIQLVDQVSPMSTVQLLDAVEGAVFIRVLVTPPELVDRVRRNLADYIEQMVDNQLRAVGLSPLGS